MFDFLFGWRKASKCKRLIRQVRCRLVLLKNKRCSIVRQVRQDVGELLKLGHAQIAFGRVGQIYKDERIIEVYDLLDHFCEFVVIHLAYIRRHKDCPNDINEAISTLIFASARCGDIPELRRIRKLFGERYGQKFVMSALELLPSNLVNSQIRNNLSIKSVAEDVKIKLMNEIFRNYNLHGSSEPPLALEYNSEWHQQQEKEDRADGTLDVEANQHSSANDDEVVCITLPEPSMSPPADHHCSPTQALLPVTQGPGKQENCSYPDSSIFLIIATLADELVESLEDIQEFQSPKSKDINLLDQRVFIFKSLVFPNTREMEDLHVIERPKKVSDRRWRKRSLSREYRSFKDISYYGKKSSGLCSNVTCKSYERRKHPKNNMEHFQEASETDEGSIHANAETRSSHGLINESGIETSIESDFYSCTDGASWRSSMPNEVEQQERFVRHTSLPVHHTHPKLPDYKELESTFLALKKSCLLNKKL